jgi:hypothetical protein
MDYFDIDAHCGRLHFPESTTAPWIKNSYDEFVGTAPHATRRHFFDAHYHAERFAELIGRPHIRKPSEEPLDVEERAQWHELKKLEEGWQMTGSWWRTVPSEVKPEPIAALCARPRISTVVSVATLNDEFFRQACFEKKMDCTSSCDSSTVAPDDTAMLDDNTPDESLASGVVTPTDEHLDLDCLYQLTRIPEGREDDTVSLISRFTRDAKCVHFGLAFRRVVGAVLHGEEARHVADSPLLQRRVLELATTAEFLKDLSPPMKASNPSSAAERRGHGRVVGSAQRGQLRSGWKS